MEQLMIKIQSETLEELLVSAHTTEQLLFAPLPSNS